jgi:hypothetical protein
MNGWDAIYTNIANANLGKILSRAQLLGLVTLAGGKSGSQGPTDYRGQRGADGKVVQAGSQSTQYRPLLFVGTGDTYEILPVAERVGKPAGTRGVTAAIAAMSPEQIREALKKAGVSIPGEPAPAPAKSGK